MLSSFEKGGNLMLTARVSRDRVMGTYEDNLFQGALPHMGDSLSWAISFARVSDETA